MTNTATTTKFFIEVEIRSNNENETFRSGWFSTVEDARAKLWGYPSEWMKVFKSEFTGYNKIEKFGRTFRFENWSEPVQIQYAFND